MIDPIMLLFVVLGIVANDTEFRSSIQRRKFPFPTLPGIAIMPKTTIQPRSYDESYTEGTRQGYVQRTFCDPVTGVEGKGRADTAGTCRRFGIEPKRGLSLGVRDGATSYHCKGNRYVFRPSLGKYELDEEIEYPIYSPSDLDTKPTKYVVGDEVRAIYNGHWEIVGASGGGSTMYAVVMESISQPDDVTAEPPSGMGKIKVLGKTYPTEDENGDPIEPEYDDCGCLLLAETEELLNEQVKVIGPFEYTVSENETKEYYLAVDIADGYDGLPLESDLTYNGTSTIKVQKGEEELEFIVYDGVLADGQKYSEGTHVLVRRTAGKLYVVDGPCPVEVEDEGGEE